MVIWSYNFLEWGILLSLPVAVSLKVNVFLLPPFLPLFSSPLSLAALLCIPPSFHLFHPSACFIFFNSPFVPFSLCFIFHNPIQSLPFRFINRSYTLPPQCCFSLILSIIASFFSLLPCTASLCSELHCFPCLEPLYTPLTLNTFMLHFSHMLYDKTQTMLPTNEQIFLKACH